jgi:hypothetical protein
MVSECHAFYNGDVFRRASTIFVCAPLACRKRRLYVELGNLVFHRGGRRRGIRLSRNRGSGCGDCENTVRDFPDPLFGFPGRRTRRASLRDGRRVSAAFTD